MAKDGVRDFQDSLDFLDPARLQIELGDHVMALALVLDAVGKAPLAPGCDLLDLAPVRLDQLADPVDLLLNALIVELGLDDVHQLVRRHTTSFLWESPRLWPALQPEQESDGQSTKWTTCPGNEKAAA